MRPFVCLAALLPTFAAATVSYTLTPDVRARTFAVRVEVPSAGIKPVFRIPAWSPGFYFLLPFGKKVSSVRATTPDGTELTVRRGDAAWTVDNPTGGDVRFTYRVLADDRGLGFFGAHLREGSGFINGASTWMYVDGRKEEGTRLQLRLPEGWDEATPMDRDGTTYVAGNYDELVDSPVQMGLFKRRRFEVDGVPYETIWVAPENAPRANLDAETERLRRASIPARRIFGRSAFKRYLYIVHLEVGDFSGGLEHRASNVIAVGNGEFLRLDDLATHEYFHAWNVKQIRPAVLGPFDYTQKVRTGNLWFAEGVTDYYAKITAYRAGLREEGYLLDAMTNALQETARSSVEKKITLEECSQRAWENGGFGVGDFSYYTKGLLVGLLFDAQIRARSAGKTSLDTVMRTLFEKTELPKPGYGENDLRPVLVAAGADGKLYDTLVRTPGLTPTDALAGIGLRVPKPGDEFVTPLYQTDSAGIVIAVGNVESALRKGDRVVNLLRPEPGETKAKARIVRDGRTLEISVPLLRTRVADLRVQFDPFADEAARARRAEWLRRDLEPIPDGKTANLR